MIEIKRNYEIWNLFCFHFFHSEEKLRNMIIVRMFYKNKVCLHLSKLTTKHWRNKAQTNCYIFMVFYIRYIINIFEPFLFINFIRSHLECVGFDVWCVCYQVIPLIGPNEYFVTFYHDDVLD